jgi:hypothetical protein
MVGKMSDDSEVEKLIDSLIELENQIVMARYLMFECPECGRHVDVEAIPNVKASVVCHEHDVSVPMILVYEIRHEEY